MRAIKLTMVFALAMASIFSSGPSTSFGPKVPVGGSAPNPFSTLRGREFPVSDAYAKAFVARYEPAAAGRMIHRVGYTHTGATPFFSDQTSTNWGGYEADNGGAFLHRSNGVKSYFRASQGSGGGGLASWIGIGGSYQGPTNLLQTGLDQKAMQAWWEIIPDANPYPRYVGVFPSEGDWMWGFIHWDSSTNMWFVQIQDATNGQYFSTYVSYQPDTRTSEWITEVPFGSGNVPSFTAVHFFNAYWYDEGDHIQTISSGESTTVWRDIMYAPYPYTGCIYPNALYGSGETFDNRHQCVP